MSDQRYRLAAVITARYVAAHSDATCASVAASDQILGMPDNVFWSGLGYGRVFHDVIRRRLSDQLFEPVLRFRAL